MISNVQSADFTQEVTYLKGQFALWRYEIPYFSSVVPLRFAAKYLSLVEQLPGSETTKWSIQELFQRDIAWDRVNDDIASYLRTENRPQFFNSLTVALIPKRSRGLEGNYETKKHYKSLERDDLVAPIEVGGIQLYSYKDSNGTAGVLRWDIDEIAAVAVDGQHRLAAIQKVADTLDGERLDGTKIPIIFLIPDERVGFSAPQLSTQEQPIASPLRRIFTDLNKNAQPVSKARQILLDDTSVTSVCVRSLLERRLGEVSGEKRIPLGLVDWLSERNKIDSGPFVTTILQLNELVESVLQVPDMTELSAENDPKFSRWLRERLDADEETVGIIMDEVARCYGREVPLTLLPREIEKIEEAFCSMWRPGLLRMIQGIESYKKVWDYSEKYNLNEPWFINLYWAEEVLEGEEAKAKADRVQSAIKRENDNWNRARDYDSHIEEINEVLKAGTWPFYIVFQRALFKSYCDLWQQANCFPGMEGISLCHMPERFADIWVEAVNGLLGSSVGDIKCKLAGGEWFWSGSGLRPDGTVEFTKAGRDRLASWLSLWVCLYWLDEVPTWTQFEKEQGGTVDIAGIAFNLMFGGRMPITEGMKRYARAKLDNPIEDDVEELVVNAKRQRFAALRKIHKKL